MFMRSSFKGETLSGTKLAGSTRYWQKISTAPKTGERILIYNELMSNTPENAFNEPVIVGWNKQQRDWESSPQVEGTRLDAPVRFWLRLFEPSMKAQPIASAPRRWMDFILVYARLRDVDFEDWVIVHWYPKTGMWRLSPYIEGADP